MRSRVKQCLIAAAIMGSMGFGPCGSSVSGPVKYGGYVRNLVTNAPLIDFLMEVDTADGIEEVSFDDESGKFEFSMPIGVDYVIRVSAEGYRSFSSANRRDIVDDPNTEEVMEINEHQSYMYNVPMIPTSITSPAIAGIVIDAGTGAGLTSGAYRIAASAVAIADTIFDDGTPAAGNRWWLSDAPVVAGALTDGTFTVPASALLPGYTYSIAVFGAAGYRDQKTSFTIGTSGTTSTTAIETSQKLTIQMVPYSNPTAPILIGQSNAYYTSATTSSPIALGSDRVITLVFDRDIVMNKRALRNVESDQLLTLPVPADSDGDTVFTSSTLDTGESISQDAYSSRVSVASSGNKVTITLAGDSTLINGTIDTDDDLQYALSGTLTAGILLKDATSGFDSWTALSALATTGNAPLNSTVLIRGNFP